MKLSQKTKYFVCGVIATVVLIPLAIKAVDTIPFQFSEGDVISANVMNNLLSRVNNVQKGYTNSSEIVGSWNCTTYAIANNCDSQFTSTGDGVTVAKSQLFRFSCTGGVCTGEADSFDPRSCNHLSNSKVSTTYSLFGNTMASGWGINGIQKISDSDFIWQVNGSLPQQTFTRCQKQNDVPNPPNNLLATVSGTSVVLTWVDQSTDETGFKVQRKTSAAGTWIDITTTAANATSYTNSNLAAGTYWYRVLATNNNGDSISSSEVQITIQ